MLRASMFGLKHEWHLTRFSMYSALQQISVKLQSREGDVLSISSSKIISELMGFKPVSFTEANYPEIDILSLPYNAVVSGIIP